jgi:hypothetical protein
MEGHNNHMTQSVRNLRRWLGNVVALGVTLVAAVVTSAPVHAQSMEKLPNDVLLFPAVVTGANGELAPMTPEVQQTQEIVTEAVRTYLAKAGIVPVVYTKRLPSIQRAVDEGLGVKPEDATKGPGDDPRLAKRFAEIVGATEYIVISVDSYAYDPQTRRATYNLTLIRSGADGTSLGTSAEKAVGESPADVSASRQEGSAVARAAEAAAEKSILNVYPQAAVIMNPPKMVVEKKKARSRLPFLIPAAAIGSFLLIPR